MAAMTDWPGFFKLYSSSSSSFSSLSLVTSPSKQNTTPDTLRSSPFNSSPPVPSSFFGRPSLLEIDEASSRKKRKRIKDTTLFAEKPAANMAAMTNWPGFYDLPMLPTKKRKAAASDSNDSSKRAADGKKEPDWAELLPELVQVVARRLPLLDYINVAAVCRSWRTEAIKENYDPRTRLPWFMVVDSDCTKFFPFSGSEIGRRRKLPRLLGHFVPHSSRGWIARGDIDGKVILFNPFSGTAIKLPALEEFRGRCLYIEQFAMSGSPSQRADYSVMVYTSGLQMWVWQSEQRAWTRVTVPPASEITQLLYYDGQFVALDRQFQILTLDMAKWSFAVRLQVNEELFLHGCPPYLVECLGPFLVECSGSLLLVCGKGTVFRVAKIDLEGRNWRGVKSLGKSSLFLNKNLYFSSFSVAFDSADESASVPEVLRPNCIYFERVNATRGFYMGIYHMERENVEQKLQGVCISSEMHGWFQPSF